MEAEVDAGEAKTATERRHCLTIDNMLAWKWQTMRAILSWGGDVGLLAAIATTSVLTTDAVPWSGLREEMGKGFGGDPHGRWMLLWDLMLGPGEVLVLNDLPLGSWQRCCSRGGGWSSAAMMTTISGGGGTAGVGCQGGGGGGG